MRVRVAKSILGVVVPYIAFAGLWIFFSDQLLHRWVEDPETRELWGTYKGWLFVAVTAVLLAFLVHAYQRAGALIERELQDSREQVRRERDFIVAILDSIPGVLYCYDENLHFLRWNRRFETVTGYSSEEITRQGPLTYFTPDERDLVAERIREVFARGAGCQRRSFSPPATNSPPSC